MSPEFWVAAAALFISGSAIGSAGTLFAQWILRRVYGPDEPRRSLEATELRLLRSDVHDISRHVHNLDARMEFTERLLGGSLTPNSPPHRFEPTQPHASTEDAARPEEEDRE